MKLGPNLNSGNIQRLFKWFFMEFLLHSTCKSGSLFVCLFVLIQGSLLSPCWAWNYNLPPECGFDTPWALDVFIPWGKRQFHSLTFSSQPFSRHTCSSLRRYQLPDILLLSYIFFICEIAFFLRAGDLGLLKWPFFIETSLDGSGKNQKSWFFLLGLKYMFWV